MGKYYNYAPGQVPDAADVAWLLDWLSSDMQYADYDRGQRHGEKTGRAYEMLGQCWSLIEPPVGPLDEAVPPAPPEVTAPSDNEPAEPHDRGRHRRHR